MGLVDDIQYQRFVEKQESIVNEIERLKQTKLSATPEVNEILAKYNEGLERGIRLAELIKRPNISYDVLKELDLQTKELNLTEDITSEVEVLLKYDGYIKRQEYQIDNSEQLAKYKIPENFDYASIKSISSESREKLEKIRPINLAQASRIGGVKPADISVLMVVLGR